MIGRSATAVFRRPAAWGSVLEVRIAGPFGSAWGLSVTAMLYTTATQNVSLFPIKSDVGLGLVDSAPMVRDHILISNKSCSLLLPNRIW